MTENQSVTRIRVTSGYSGQRIRGAYIPEGDYAIDDPRLLEQGEFLLTSGRAVSLDDGNPTVITVPEGQVDRDLAGKPIVVPVGQNQGHISNTAAPVFAQFPNNASASEVIQPYEIGATEPAAVEGSEHKLAGTVSAKPEPVARAEAAVTDAAVEEAEAVREHAEETDDPDAEADAYSDMNLDRLREEAKTRGVQPLDDDGNAVAISKAKRASLEAALRTSD